MNDLTCRFLLSAMRAYTSCTQVGADSRLATAVFACNVAALLYSCIFILYIFTLPCTRASHQLATFLWAKPRHHVVHGKPCNAFLDSVDTAVVCQIGELERRVGERGADRCIAWAGVGGGEGQRRAAGTHTLRQTPGGSSARADTHQPPPAPFYPDAPPLPPGPRRPLHWAWLGSSPGPGRLPSSCLQSPAGRA